MTEPQKPLETKEYKSRVVTLATHWWAENTPTDKHEQLYCIHKVKLTVSCNSCRDTTAKE